MYWDTFVQCTGILGKEACKVVILFLDTMLH